MLGRRGGGSPPREALLSIPARSFVGFTGVCLERGRDAGRERTATVLARVVLVLCRMTQQKDPNQGEGDRASARRYDDHVRDFVSKGKVDPAAGEARAYLEREPDDAAKAEAAAKRGPRASATVDQVIAKGHSLLERVRPMVARLRERFGRK